MKSDDKLAGAKLLYDTAPATLLCFRLAFHIFKKKSGVVKLRAAGAHVKAYHVLDQSRRESLLPKAILEWAGLNQVSGNVAEAPAGNLETVQS